MSTLRSNHQPILWRSIGKLILLDLLQQFILVVLEVQIEIASTRPLPSRQEEGVSVHTLVTQDPKQTTSSILCGCKFHTFRLYLLKSFFGQNFGLDIPTLLLANLEGKKPRSYYLPRRDNIHTTAIIMSSPSQRMHNASDSPLRSRIGRSPGHIQECGTRANENQTSIFLLLRRLFAILLDEVMRGEFCGVQCTVQIHLYGFQTRLCRSVFCLLVSEG